MPGLGGRLLGELHGILEEAQLPKRLLPVQSAPKKKGIGGIKLIKQYKTLKFTMFLPISAIMQMIQMGTIESSHGSRLRSQG